MLRYQLDLQFFAEEKTEKATPKKRQDVRKKGQVAKSQDVNTAVILLAAFFALLFSGTSMLESIRGIFRHTFQDYIFRDVTVDNLVVIARQLFPEFLKIIGPVMLAGFVAALSANLLQVGFLFTTEPLTLKPERIDPVKGFKRIVSLRAVVELLKSLLKVIIIGVIASVFLVRSIEEILALIFKTPGASLAVLGSVTIKMGLFAAGGLLFLAVLDYLYQKYDFEKNIRMSKKDIQDELKNTEGDPLIKSKRKQRQREISMQRMMQEIPDADVVITNPTHFAVALKYDEKKMDAPYVVAKGVDYIALKIREIAKSHDVMVVEDRHLARSLYEQTEIGQEIPEAFFKAVAEILAYVYRLEGKI